MQESGPASPIDEGPEQDRSPSETPGSGKPAGQETPAPAVRPTRTADPVIRWLTLGIAGVIILWLVSILSALMFGLLSPSAMPRTAAERDLNVLGAQVQSGQATSWTYAQYVSTLIRAGQLSRAQAALDQSLKIAKTDRSYLLAAQAQLLMAQKDYAGAAAAADKATAAAQKELKAFMDKNVANNRKPTAGAKMPDSFLTAALVKAEALVESKETTAAIKAFDVYLKQQPTDSDILVMRATAKAQVGDKKGAEADYRAALKYIPDYKPALDGLKQIGAAR